MKKLLPLLVILSLLAGCDLPGSSTGQPTGEPTMTDNEMATRVAQILTTIPTATIEQKPTQPLPTVPGIPTQAPTSPQPPALPTNTPEPTITASFTPTFTLEPTWTPEPTFTPTATFTPSVVPTQGPTPYPEDPRLKLGMPAWSDAMVDGRNWVIDDDQLSNAKIENNALVITGKQKIHAWRLAMTPLLSNVYIEATIQNDGCAGEDSSGIFFNVPVATEANRGYLYGVSCSGMFFLKKWDGTVKPNGELTTLIPNTKSTVIKQGPKENNRVGVMIAGNRFVLYANGAFLKEYKDSSKDAFTFGYFGVFVKPTLTLPFVIRVDEVSYWTNPGL